MTHHVTAMLETHPEGSGGIDQEKLAACIAACFECAQTCTACADACLGEDMVADLRTCIRTDADCADICEATGKVFSRRMGGGTATVRALLEACRTACKACGDERARHVQMHEHCRSCADVCRRCEQACAALLPSLG